MRGIIIALLIASAYPLMAEAGPAANKVALIKPVYTKYASTIEQVVERLEELEKFPESVNKRQFAATVLAQIVVESAGKPEAVSHTNDHGLMQLQKATRKEVEKWLRVSFSSDVYHSWENICAGAGYLALLIERHDISLREAILAYNAGYGGLLEWRTQRQIENHPYVQKVIHIRTMYLRAALS